MTRSISAKLGSLMRHNSNRSKTPPRSTVSAVPSSDKKLAKTTSSTSSTSTAATAVSMDDRTQQQQQQQQQQQTQAQAHDDRKKHVEVCVRIRPMMIENGSSSSFFRAPSSSAVTAAPAPSSISAATPPRKPSIPRISGLRASRLGGNQNKSASPEPVPAPAIEPAASYAWKVMSDDTVCQSEHTDIIQGRTHTYTLDRVYGPSINTQKVFDCSVKELVHAAVGGYHTSVLAYGQTSTGKTHTMTGTPDQPGLIPLCVQEVFDCIFAASTNLTSREYLLRVSYLEVYKEHIRDLLATSPAAPPVRLFDSGGADGLIIKGLREQVVTSPAEVFALLREGESRRQIGATTMNQHSSRSHVLVRIWIESKSVGGGGGNGAAQAVRVSSLSLVDLAGSESVRLTGSNERREEGHYINKSLMTLGQVVYALSEVNDAANGGNASNSSKRQHVPYRDSKLTRLLQPSLSGNAQVVLICCISPMVQHLEESHNTFKFATRAKKIPQRATIQETADEKTLLQGYRQEIEDLKQQLKEAREQQERYMAMIQQNGRTAAVAVTAPVVDTMDVIVSESEIAELVEAIQTMEKLILKSNPLSGATNTKPQSPEDLLDISEGLLDSNDDEENLLALVEQPQYHHPPPSAMSPTRDSSSSSNSGAAVATPVVNKDLQSDLSRVQGLLGSVLKRRMRGDNQSKQAQTDMVRTLRQQLEDQQVSTDLRKADASFLQAQLEEKDKLLLEVSKILEAVEERQAKLESENAQLRKQVALYQQYQTLQTNSINYERNLEI